MSDDNWEGSRSSQCQHRSTKERMNERTKYEFTNVKKYDINKVQKYKSKMYDDKRGITIIPVSAQKYKSKKVRKNETWNYKSTKV